MIEWRSHSIMSYMGLTLCKREVKSGWELRPRRRRSSVSPDTAAKLEERQAAVARNRTSDQARSLELHDQREAALCVAPAVLADAVELCAEVGAEGPGPGGADALGELGKRALLIAQHPASWQRVLHGNETMLREEVTKALLDKHGEKSAFRYAACGLADRMVRDAGGLHVAPMGCGHRLCPRCGRTKGKPMINRIFGWLAAKEHGDVMTMCLTQRVIRGETLPAARARMVRKEQEYLAGLKAEGLISAASCAHPIWSEFADGWHYHVHLLLEFPKGTMSARGLRARWLWWNRGERLQADERSSSLVVAAGPADPKLIDGSSDPDFFTERSDGLAAAVQYPVRDIAQGISAKRLGGDRVKVAECVAVLLNKAKGWKLRRTYGQWRKKPPALAPTAQPEKTEEEKKAASTPAGVAVVFGTVHQCGRQAARGDAKMKELFCELEVNNRNDTDFGKRLLTFCRSVYRGRAP